MDDRHYLIRVGNSLSQLLNTIILNGDPDESISGRSYRRGMLEHSKKWRILMNILDKIFWWDYQHCMKSHYNDVNRALRIINRR